MSLSREAAPSVKLSEAESQAIKKTAQDFYTLKSTGDIWPQEYRHARTLPEEVKQRLTAETKARELKLWTSDRRNVHGVAGTIGPAQESAGIQKIAGGGRIISFEDLVATQDNVQVNVIVWSWFEDAIYDASTNKFVSQPKYDSFFVDHLTFKKEDGEWKIAGRRMYSPLGDLRRTFDPGKRIKFGMPTVEEARSLYDRLKAEEKRVEDLIKKRQP